jgi:hypothetical protein
MRDTIESLSPTRRQANFDLREYGKARRAEIVAADNQERHEAALAELTALGNVRDLPRAQYATAKRDLLRLLRIGGRR